MPRKGKSGKPVSREEVAQWRDEYVVSKNCTEIAAKYQRDVHTIIKYRDEEKWDEYAEKIEQRTDELAINQTAKRRAKALVMVNAALSKMAKDLANKDTIAFSSTELDRLLRLAEYLTGNPDSRNESILKGASIDDAIDLIAGTQSLEQIEAEIARLEGSQGKDQGSAPDVGEAVSSDGD